jgi:hypothetical protein
MNVSKAQILSVDPMAGAERKARFRALRSDLVPLEEGLDGRGAFAFVLVYL